MNDTHHFHNDWSCPAHTCGPDGSAQACSHGEEREVFTCNPYQIPGWCPDDGYEPSWSEMGTAS